MCSRALLLWFKQCKKRWRNALDHFLGFVNPITVTLVIFAVEAAFVQALTSSLGIGYSRSSVAVPLPPTSFRPFMSRCCGLKENKRKGELPKYANMYLQDVMSAFVEFLSFR